MASYNFEKEQIVSTAKARYQRGSARKTRLVADLIRGKTVSESLNILRMTHRPSATLIIGNLLKSAVANAEQKDHKNTDELVVGELQVDGGQIMYRFRPRARGRASKIRKRFCHASIKLIEE